MSSRKILNERHFSDVSSLVQNSIENDYGPLIITSRNKLGIH